MTTNVYFVIPAYNEEQTIGKVIRELRLKYRNTIVVDDGSTDLTHDVAMQAGAIVLRHLVNRGQGAALQTGITYALQKGAECIVTFDADGQHDVGDIPALLKPIQDGVADVVLGSRFIELRITNYKLRITDEIPFFRKAVLKLGLFHQWVFSGLRITDSQCGLRAFSRTAAEAIQISQDRMAHGSEILEKIARHKLRFTEIPVSVRYTQYSLRKGQKSFSGSIRILLDFFIGRFVK